jgi:hypothetical protein
MIIAYKTTSMDVQDQRDLRENKIRDKIFLKTSRRMTWSELRRMAPVPQWNQEHPREAGFYLDFIKPEHTHRLIWTLDAEYTPIKGGQIDANPLARPAVITFDSTLVDQPTLFDAEGRPIVNTAGEFITGMIAKIPLVDYTAKLNLASDPRWLQTHIGRLNKDTIKLRGLTWAPKTLLLAGVAGGEFVTENRVEYAEYTLKILADPRTWTQQVWNRGTVELFEDKAYKAVTGKVRYYQKAIKQGDPPEFVSEPVPLTREGKLIKEWLNPGEQPADQSKLVTLEFDCQALVSFAELRLS